MRQKRWRAKPTDALEEKTDEEIREAVESDPDAYFLDEDWFESAVLVNPSAEKERISIHLDKGILEFFRAGGKGIPEPHK